MSEVQHGKMKLVNGKEKNMYMLTIYAHPRNIIVVDGN